MKKFNYIKAKQDGYSDEEIQDYLRSKYSYNFNIVKAKQDGYSDEEIQTYINQRLNEISEKDVDEYSAWSKYPCVTSRPDFKNYIDVYGIYIYKSTSPDYGEVWLSLDGRFKSYEGKYKSGDWSCTNTGKIYLIADELKYKTPEGFRQSNATSEDIKNGKLVKFGMTGDIVKEIQKLLKDKGYAVSKTGDPDGIFGIRTYNSVKKFQSLNGLKTDGVVGQQTYAKLTDPNSVKYDGSPYTGNNQVQIKECNDFPFTFGCRNKQIGDIRKKVIGDDKDMFDNDLLNALKNRIDVWPIGTKVITQDVYNKIMSN